MLFNLKGCEPNYRVLLTLFAIATLGTNASSHGGGLDRHGCHTDRSTNEYHCHKADGETHEQVPSSISIELVPYERRQWGGWKDFDKDCQNTRVEELIDHGNNIILSESLCTVQSGVWLDPFSGIAFYDPSELDIDHIVPLSWAHAHGGSSWSKEQKQAFSNDPENLLPVQDNLNQSKGDSSPLEWLPPNDAFHCDYLQRWQFILLKYPSLKFDEVEAQQFKALISSKCI